VKGNYGAMYWAVQVFRFENDPPERCTGAPREPHPVPLGARDEVIACLTRAVPEIVWERHPSGLAWADQVDDWIDAGKLTEFARPYAQSLRQGIGEREVTIGRYDHDNVHVRLSGFDLDPVKQLFLSIWGDGCPMAFLRSIAQSHGWHAYWDVDGHRIDLKSSSSWDRFRRYRGEGPDEPTLGHNWS
jgi:hypothetical protein